MAGIEGVSAIIAVVQVGFALSKALIEYIDEVKDASSRIRRVGNEIRTTSERLQDIGKLVEKNPITNVFSSEGIQSAIRASDECGQVIGELRTILAKSGYTPSPTVVQKEEIDISSFTKFKWPFVKFRLEVPRAELQRIKTDLTLLFTSVMAISASTEADKRFYCEEIVNVEKTRKWAALKARRARQRAKKADRKGGRESPYRGSSVDSFTDDEEDERILTEFMEFKEDQAIAREKQRQEEQLALLRVKEDARREAEEKERKVIENMGVVKYKEAVKRQLTERESRNAATKEALRAELERLNFPSNQMQSILDNINVAVNDDTDSVIALRGLGHDLSANSHSPAPNPNSNSKSGNNKSKGKLRWRLWKHSQNPSSSPRSPPHSPLIPGAWDDSVLLESWVFESSSGLWSEFKEGHMEKGAKQEPQRFWNQYSQLPAKHRNSFQDFYYGKNKTLTDQEKWVILSLEPIKRVIKTGIFSRIEEDIGLRVLVARKDVRPSASGVAVPSGNEDEETPVSPVEEPDKESPPPHVPPYQSAEIRTKYLSPENRKAGSERSGIPPTRINYSPHRGYRSAKPRDRTTTVDEPYLSDVDNNSFRDFNAGRRRERLRDDEVRVRDRFTDYTYPYRRSSEMYPRSRTMDQFHQPYRSHNSSHKPLREKDKDERFHQRSRTALRQDSDWPKGRHTSHFVYDKNMYDDDAWNSDRSFIRVRKHRSAPLRRDTSLQDENIHERFMKQHLEKKNKKHDAQASEETALVLSTLNRLTTYQGNELPPRQSTTVPINPLPTTVVIARGPPPDPAPFDPYDPQQPTYGYTPLSNDPSWVANRTTETRLDKPYQEYEESSQRPTDRSRRNRDRRVVPPYDIDRGRQLQIAAPPDPQITVSGASPTLPRPASRSIYDSPVSIGHTASVGTSPSDTSSDEENTHSFHRTRDLQTSGDDTEFSKSRDINDGKGNGGENNVNGIN